MAQDPLFFLFAVTAVLALVAAVSPVRWALVAFTALVVVHAAELVALTGGPRPVHLDPWFPSGEDAGDITVLAARLEEPETIYLWLVLPGAEAPAYYELPWSEEAARQLMDAMEAAEEGGEGEVRMRPPTTNDAREPVFYVAPPTPGPPKA